MIGLCDNEPPNSLSASLREGMHEEWRAQRCRMQQRERERGKRTCRKGEREWWGESEFKAKKKQHDRWEEGFNKHCSGELEPTSPIYRGTAVRYASPRTGFLCLHWCPLPNKVGFPHRHPVHQHRYDGHEYAFYHSIGLHFVSNNLISWFSSKSFFFDPFTRCKPFRWPATVLGLCSKRTRIAPAWGGASTTWSRA
jgi:hypothetical protein